MSTPFTVLGGSGHIGSRLCRWLSARSIPYRAPARGEPLPGESLGHVIYAIGLTADFRERPLDAVTAHVSCLVSLLETAEFESLLYLSSTRVYQHCPRAEEEEALQVHPTRPQDVYNISKIMGEAACLASGRRGLRVARLANVYGPEDSESNFLPSIVRDALGEGRVILRSGLGSEKDYVSVEEILPVLVAISREGRETLYNVASGRNTTHREIVRILQEETGCRVEVQAGARDVTFPPIAVERVRREFGFAPSSLSDDLPGLIRALRARHEARR
jgi:nucleoside-diphosphate-sugar epimerase